IEMDGEVYDEVDNSARSFHIYNDVIFPARVFLLNYGWYILASAFVLHQIFTRFICPRLHQQREYATVGAAKKSDADNDRFAVARRAARERQQAHHDKVAAEAEAEKRRKEKEKLAKLREEMAQRSVVENALLDYKMAKDRKEKEKLGKGDTEESAADFLLRIVVSAPIVIVSKSFCPFSRKAKATFATYRLPRDEVVYLELDELGEKREKAVRAEMARIYERERVPAVFIAGDFIGDHDAVVAQQRDGVLDVLVKEATESWRTNRQ
ncbi:hypothetical protein PRIPAC_93249, partial [Pristionchus pacificus]